MISPVEHKLPQLLPILGRQFCCCWFLDVDSLFVVVLIECLVFVLSTVCDVVLSAISSLKSSC